MTPHQHARMLFEEAEKEGMDAPSEDKVSDALSAAMDNAVQDCEIALRQGGFGQAADFIRRLQKRMWAGDRVLHAAPRTGGEKGNP